MNFLIAYLLGSIPFGYLAGKVIKGIDIREHGSGNLGATNVFRVVGKTWGIVVLILDALKGYVAVALASRQDPVLLIFVGVVAILGHAFPVWLKFKGGKGVATSLGVFLGIAWLPTLITFGLWIVVFFFSRIISLASLAASLLFPVVIFLTIRETKLFVPLFVVSFVLAAFIFYTHRANIQRIIKGEEKKII